MKTLCSLVLLCISVLCFSQQSTTFILVRHAEKAKDGTNNPSLNETGKLRSINLGEMLSNQEIDALYATPFKRTEETLQPIAERTALEITSYDPYSKGEWLESLLEKHIGETIVISGHSNTIPGLANSLLGEEKFQQFDESDYSNLLIIVADEIGQGKLVRLKF